MITIALTKGYLLKETLNLLSKAGIQFPSVEEISRKLEVLDRSGTVRALIMRPTDVPVYVEYGAADLGVTGKDVLLENPAKVAELLDLKFGGCQLVLAGLKNRKIELNRDLRVATKFVNSARTYFNAKNLNVEIIKLYGSVELAPQSGLADLIIDLTASGQTLKENGLEIRETIYHSSARLIGNSIKLRTQYNAIIKLAKELKQQL